LAHERPHGDTVTRYSDLAGTSAVALTEYVFDEAGRLDTVKHHQGATTAGTLLAGYDYTFNKRHQLDAIDFLPCQYDTEDVTYNYDNRGQLEGANQSGTNNDETYTYDENGNRVTANGSTYATGDNNQLLGDGTYTYEYDKEGNRTKRTEIATGDYTEYEWDHRNRLVSVTDKNSSGTVMQTVEYTYDYLNQLIGRTVDGTDQTVYLFDNGQVVLQFEGGAANDLVEGDLTNRYLWGNTVDQLLADEQVDWVANGEADGDTLWALTDHLGTVRDLVDDSGVLKNHKSYDGFGNVTNETVVAVDTVFGFTGKLYDDATKLQNNLNRWYDAKVGKWISEDPIGFAAGDANVSRYVGNEALIATDPSGEYLQIVVGAGIGAIEDIVWQLTVDGATWDEINWATVATSAALGAVLPGSFIGSGSKVAKSFCTIWQNKHIHKFWGSQITRVYTLFKAGMDEDFIWEILVASRKRARHNIAAAKSARQQALVECFVSGVADAGVDTLVNLAQENLVDDAAPPEDEGPPWHYPVSGIWHWIFDGDPDHENW